MNTEATGIRALAAAELDQVTGAAPRSAAPRPVPIPYDNIVPQSGGTFFSGTNEAAGERA
jgi:hypothetical protein